MAANTHSLDLELSSSQFAYVADSAFTSVTAAATFECWINLESTPGSGLRATAISKFKNDTSDISYLFAPFNNAGTPQLELFLSADGSGNELFQANWTPSTATWYHIAATFNGAAQEVKLYVDGVQLGTTLSSTMTAIFDSVASFSTGAINPLGTPSNFFDGLIDEIRVWNVVRTQAEILANMQKDVTGQSGLRVYYKLNNDYLDASGNGQTLTASGSPSFSTTVPFVNYATGGGFFGLM